MEDKNNSTTDHHASLLANVIHQDEDSADSSSSSSTTSDRMSTARSEDKTGSSGDDVLVQRESRVVKRSKLIVYIALAIAAGTVGALTYYLTAQSQQTTFENDFKGHANEVVSEAESNVQAIMGQIESMSLTVTSYTLADNQTWPFVTVPHFELRAHEASSLSGVDLLLFAPIVTSEHVNAWENYSWEQQTWIEDSFKYLDDAESSISPGAVSRHVYNYTAEMDQEDVDHHDEGDHDEGDHDEGDHDEHEGHDRRRQMLQDRVVGLDSFALPIWQMGPIPRNAAIFNLDLHTVPSLKKSIDEVVEARRQVLTGIVTLHFLDRETERVHHHVEVPEPASVIIDPVIEDFLSDSPIKGFLFGQILWRHFFDQVLPEGTNGLIVEASSTCGGNFTYQINGPEPVFLGYGEHHDVNFEYMRLVYPFARPIDEIASSEGHSHRSLQSGSCLHTLSVYPSAELQAAYQSNTPAVYTSIVVLVFFFTALTFATYDYVVDRRQKKLLAKANRTAAIVSSIFPKDIQKRLLAEAEAKDELENQRAKKGRFGARNPLKDLVDDDEDDNILPYAYNLSQPNADFFPEVTVMFADIVGFTAWSSTREPNQVFSLLETIFHEFDQLGKRRRIFKVETVGDCYVAVAGLPDPRPDHALVMVRFARDCLFKFGTVAKQLEVTLGPDTSELGIRIGLHSGPVTAGVLRGDRARFQLFGDTMNTCARIESTGVCNKIQLSQETVDRLTVHGKGHWCQPRDDRVVAKGKGELITYWLHVKGYSAQSSRSSSSGTSDEAGELQDQVAAMAATPPSAAFAPLQTIGEASQEDGALSRAFSVPALSEKKLRLVRWNTEALAKVLREVVARREASGVTPTSLPLMRKLERDQQEKKGTVLDEVQEVITLPQFDSEAAKKHRDSTTATTNKDLDPEVHRQLHEYLQTISALYRDNAFHNFEHASHVTMSVVKLLSRIVAPSHLLSKKKAAPLTAESLGSSATSGDFVVDVEVDRDLHDHTYGITSDPLTQFSVILAALIHDVDHTGVPNTQLVLEQASIAAAYHGKSVAEQNSLDLAWDLLMQDQFELLRRTIYGTVEEFRRFRQLLVNVVMATDIMDKELGAARKDRWNKAFAEGADGDATAEGGGEGDGGGAAESESRRRSNRKATIVIEHLIQASDVAHTMQHWQVYRKWNARFFEECYTAYLMGRAAKDPSESWYEGELGFFDYYILPLAKKLKDCGVFGVSSDEYWNYAKQNRREWEGKGRQAVAEMVERCRHHISGAKAKGAGSSP